MNKALTIFLVIAGLLLAGCAGYLLGKVSQEEVFQTESPSTEKSIGTAGDSYSTQRIAAEEINPTSTSSVSIQGLLHRPPLVLAV